MKLLTKMAERSSAQPNVHINLGGQYERTQLSIHEFRKPRKITPLRPTWEDYEQEKKKIYDQDTSIEEREYQVRCLIDELGL